MPSAVRFVARAALDIHDEGAHKSLTDPGSPDLGRLSLPVTANGIAHPDGYRFVRFRIVVSDSAPPASTINDVHPAIQEISIGYEAPLGCP